MEGWLIIALIFWIVSSVSRKKKQAQQAEKRRAEGGQTPSSPAAGREQPKRAGAPREGMPKAAFPDAEPRTRGTAPERPAERPARPQRPGRVKAAEGTTLTSPETRLTKPAASERHELEASQLTGHAHEETSLTGISEECEPAARPKRESLAPAAVSAPAAVPKLSVEDLRRAVVFSEILAKPKALRRRVNG